MKMENMVIEMNLEGREKDDYERIMHESQPRRDEAEYLIGEIEHYSNRTFDKMEKEAISDLLRWFSIDDGVTVFTTSSAPADKRFIGRIELRTEFLNLYWGLNNNSGRRPYALGCNFRNKSMTDVVYFNKESFTESFPILAYHVMSSVDCEHVYSMKVYPKAGELYAETKNQAGKWLAQTPTEKGQFVPNRGIGFFEPEKMLIHIFDPKAKCKSMKKYSMQCTFYE